MKIDVFVSYHNDSSRNIADLVVSRLEGAGVRCWYAPRDVEGSYAGSIKRAIDNCSIFLLLLNKAASNSPHVLNELELAHENRNIKIIPFHIDDKKSDMSDDVNYYISRIHWIDGTSPTIFERIDELTQKVLDALGRPLPSNENNVSQEETQSQNEDHSSLFEYTELYHDYRIETLLPTDKNHIVIPSAYNGKPVRSINYRAFSDRKTLTSVTIPTSITNIEADVFDGCSNLTDIYCETIVLPSGWNTDWLHGCKATVHWGYNKSVAGGKLEFEFYEDYNAYVIKQVISCDNGSVTIPSTYNGKPVVAIAGEAFENCMALKSITIPNNIVSIGFNAFCNCELLTNVVLSDSLTHIDGFKNCKSLKEITLPEGVKSIDDSAFLGCSALKNINIPNNVECIEWNAFEDCRSLTKITLPASIKIMGGNVFQGCKKLKNIYCEAPAMPAGWDADWLGDCQASVHWTTANNTKKDTEIDRSSFFKFEFSNELNGYKIAGVHSLNNEKLVIPSSYNGKPVVAIGDFALQDCQKLTEVVIPNSIVAIGLFAFEGCVSLLNVNLPNSVIRIGGSAFQNCDSLSSITIPDSVKYIGAYAFNGCNFTSIAIPKSVECIKSRVFQFCPNLKNIFCEEFAKPSSWDDDWIYGTDATVHWRKK